MQMACEVEAGLKYVSNHERDYSIRVSPYADVVGWVFCSKTIPPGSFEGRTCKSHPVIQSPSQMVMRLGDPCVECCYSSIRCR